MTADVLYHALEDKSIRLAAITLLILDECHHTLLKHPYSKVMMEYVKAKHEGLPGLPQVCTCNQKTIRKYIASHIFVLPMWGLSLRLLYIHINYI